MIGDSLVVQEKPGGTGLSGGLGLQHLRTDKPAAA